LPWGRLSL